MDLLSILYFLIIAVGFGFVIFWHELGHFLAAKWAGVRVEQFAIGFGQAIVSFRKGLGFRFGTSGPEYQQILQAQRQGLAPEAGELSPTEYRLNWIPFGGYVKMYGQEDMVASTTSTEPDHYMNKTVGQRMVIISAGVVMNVILAAILFTVLFMWGYHPPAALVGQVVPGTPAEKAGIQIGDRVVAINDTPVYHFTQLSVTTALLRPGEPARFVLQPAGTEAESERKLIEIQPEPDATTGMISIGILPTVQLKAVHPRYLKEDEESLRRRTAEDLMAVGPGETIVAVNGTPVELDDYYILDRALSAARGEPVAITIQTLDGQIEQRTLRPRLLDLGELPEATGRRVAGGYAYAGLLPLVEVLQVQPDSPSLGELLPGDVVERIVVQGTADTVSMPSFEQMRSVFSAAGKAGQKVDLVVRRRGERVTLHGLELALIDRGRGQHGLGFMPAVDTGSTTLGGVAPDSPASAAGVPAQGRVVEVDGQEVATWLQIHLALQAAAERGAGSVDVSIARGEGAPTLHTLQLTEAARQAIAAVEPTAPLFFLFVDTNQVKTTLQTGNPLQAIWWGVRETKDQILNLYITLKRVTIDQTVSPRNLTGPVGIFQFGTIVAKRGPDWYIWFLALISANLAVVNFLPIPILDGGHMVFLVSEKLTGRPPSPRIQTAALYAGLLLIVGLVLFVTYNDLQRLLL